MSFKEIANSGLLWTMVIIGIILVAVITMYYYYLCRKHALKVGISKETINAVVKSSLSFSIVPSLAIVTGLASLAVVIGLPYGWFRLSVLGSVTYELMAANLALSALGVDVNNAGADAFILMSWAMCIGITSTMIANLCLCKPMHLGSVKLGDKDQRWGALSQSTFMIALLCALTVPMIFGGLVSLMTFITSIVIAVIISALSKATGAKWLAQFSLAFSLIGAMASSVLWNNLFG